MKVSLKKLKDTTKTAITKYGYNQKETEIILNILLYAQLRGSNQGVIKLMGKGIPKRKEGKPPLITKETPVSALVDGNKTHAMIVMNQISDIAIDKAQKSHIGLAGNFNTDESTGAIGYYANKIAQQGLIGLVFSASPFQTTAPFGSNQALFCTNPLSYGIPTTADPIVLDMSTSAMAYYGLIEAKTAGKNVPADIGYNAEGKVVTNPAEIMSGAIKAFGAHKGSGLALLVQVLATTFVTADWFDSDSDNAGNLVMAIDPEIFVDLDEFKKNISEMASIIKESRKAEGVQEIFLPGEQGNQHTKKITESGEIEVEDNLWSELQKIANK